MNQIDAVSALVVVCAAIVAAVIDVRSFRIPNWLTVPLLLSGLAFQGGVHGWSGLGQGVFGSLIGFGVTALFYVLGAMGAGDVKFTAAVGAWFGPVGTLYVFAVAGLSTTAYSLGVLAWQNGLHRAVQYPYVFFLQLATIGRHVVGGERVQDIAKQPDRRRRLVPFGAMVAFAVIVLLAWALGRHGRLTADVEAGSTRPVQASIQ